MNTTHQGGPDSQAAIDADRLCSRDFPERRKKSLDNPNVSADKRHQERRRFAEQPDLPSAFAEFGK